MRFVSWIVILIVGAAAIAFAVSNRDSVSIDLSPLPVIFEAPVFAFVFAAVLVGFIGGGMVSWVSGSKARRRARRLARQVAKLEKENEALKDRDPAPEDAPAAADAGPPFDSAI